MMREQMCNIFDWYQMMECCEMLIWWIRISKEVEVSVGTSSLPTGLMHSLGI